MKYTLFGAPHSGTRYLGYLIRNNFKDIESDKDFYENYLYWKHGSPNGYAKTTFCDNLTPKQIEEHDFDTLDENDDVGIVVIFKNPYSWYYSVKRRYGDQYRTLMTQYNEKNRGFLELDYNYDNIKYIRYDQLLSNPKSVLGGVVKGLGTVLDLPFENMSDRPDSDSSFDKGFYLDREYFDWLLEDDIEAVKVQTDWDLVDNMGYDVDYWRNI